MADIFLSYAREDLAVANRFATAFERAGLSVWWDQSLSPGETFDHATETALREARAVVVLWSPHSVQSRWVRAEATMADRHHTLVPVMIAPCERPILFELTQTSDLIGWQGDATDAAWQTFLASVQRMVTHGRPVGVGIPAAAPVKHVAPLPFWRREVVAAGAVVMLVLTIVIGLINLRTPDESVPATDASVAAPVNARPRIAVLPFQNLSPDPANAFFADGLHEEILTALSNSGAAMDVISRTTMMTFRNNPKSMKDIGRELNADYVVEGSVRRDQDNVRLTLQLIDARTDSHAWSQNFDRKLVNAMTLQSEVAEVVARRLAVQVSPVAQSLTAPPTRDPEAYDYYLQAKLASRLISGASSGQAIQDVIDLYSKAIARDPDFGLAYLGRVSMGPGEGIPIDEWTQRSARDLEAARRLLGDDPRIGLLEAFNASGGPFADFGQALSIFEAAEAKGLNDPEFLNNKGSVLMSAGRVEEALELRKKLVSLDPANPRLLLALAADSFVARQPREALKAIDMMRRQLPPEYGPIWEDFAKDTRFQFTGDARWFEVPIGRDVPADFDAALLQDVILRNLRFERRYAEILQRLSDIKGPLMPSDSLFQSYNMGQSPPPVARLRGWAHLLMGNRNAARADGREVLGFKDLAPAGATGEAAWLDKLRRAEGHLFAGDPKKAAAVAREGMALMPRTRNAMLWDYASAMGAAVLAWSGQEDEAAALLETLATEAPGLTPASITRDPVYAVPLKDNARYQALSERLEAQMAATKL